MSNHYGPWATMIDAGSNPQLSAFWKSRLTRLVPTSRTSPTLSRRNLVLLGAGGVLMTILPTFYSAPANADEKKPVREGKSVSAGRIFAPARLKVQPKGSEKEEEFQGIISIDPETGKWEKIKEDYGRISPDGKSIAYSISKNDENTGVKNDGGRVGTDQIWVFDRKSKQSSKIVDNNGSILCWSPDSKQVIVVAGHSATDDRSRRSTWQVNIDGSGQKKLPIPETDETDDWSPDGKWFVTVTNREPPFGRGYQLYRMRPDGSEELRLTKGGLNCCPRFSPDSQNILYLHQTAKEGNSLRIVHVDGKNDRELCHEEGLKSVGAGCFSPDGRRVAVQRYNWRLNEQGTKVVRDSESAKYRLEIMNADGTNRRELPLVGAKVVWLGHPDWR